MITFKNKVNSHSAFANWHSDECSEYSDSLEGSKKYEIYTCIWNSPLGGGGGGGGGGHFDAVVAQLPPTC